MITTLGATQVAAPDRTLARRRVRPGR